MYTFYATAPGGVSGHLHSPIVLPQVELLRYPLYMKRAGPRVGRNVFEKRNIP
jgi:hypothetical protein